MSHSYTQFIVMKEISTQQEILLVTGTSFSSRQLLDMMDPADKSKLSEIEKLEEACVNGLLQETFPELCLVPNDSGKLYIWGIKEGNAFIAFDLSEYPEDKDNYFSVDPYLFMLTKSDN